MLESESMQTKKSAIWYNYYCPYSVLTISIPYGDVSGKKPLHYPYIENIKASLHSGERICFLTCPLGLVHPLSSHWIKYRSSRGSRALVPYLTSERPNHRARASHSLL